MTTGRINQVARDEASTHHALLGPKDTNTAKHTHATPGIRHAARAAAPSIAGPYRRADRANSPEVQFRHQSLQRRGAAAIGISTNTPETNQKMHAKRAPSNRTPSCKLTAPSSLGTRRRSRTSSDHSKESHQCSAVETRRP
jgi:hypothetical protein